LLGEKNGKNCKKFAKIYKNFKKLRQIGAFWTVIKVPPRAFERAGRKW
jgi:hypothetical protein